MRRRALAAGSVAAFLHRAAARSQELLADEATLEKIVPCDEVRGGVGHRIVVQHRITRPPVLAQAEQLHQPPSVSLEPLASPWAVLKLEEQPQHLRGERGVALSSQRPAGRRHRSRPLFRRSADRLERFERDAELLKDTADERTGVEFVPQRGVGFRAVLGADGRPIGVDGG